MCVCVCDENSFTLHFKLNQTLGIFFLKYTFSQRIKYDVLRERLCPREWLFPSLLMGNERGTKARGILAGMINSSGIPRLILFISFIRNEAVRALIYTAASFISSTTLSHTRHHFFAVSLVSVDSLLFFRRWRELITLQIAAEYKRFSYLIFRYMYNITYNLSR